MSIWPSVHLAEAFDMTMPKLVDWIPLSFWLLPLFNTTPLSIVFLQISVGFIWFVVICLSFSSYKRKSWKIILFLFKKKKIIVFIMFNKYKPQFVLLTQVIQQIDQCPVEKLQSMFLVKCYNTRWLQIPKPKYKIINNLKIK